MATNELRFHFFRLTVHRKLLTPPGYSERAVLTAALKTTQDYVTQLDDYNKRHPPATRTPQEEPHFWIVQNVEEVEEGSGVYSFFIGRNRTKMVPVLSDAGFEKVFSEEFPHTLGLLDTNDALCAIAANSQVHPEADKIAYAFHGLMEASTANAQEYYVDMEMRPINDPNSFLESITRAYAVTAFDMTVFRPNPPNEGEFSKEIEDFLDKLEGTYAHAQVKGQRLNIDKIIPEAKATLALGGSASATIKDTPESTPRRVDLNEEVPLVAPVRVEGTDPKRQAMSIWNTLREKWEETFKKR